MTERCNQTILVTRLAASVSLSLISDHHLNRLSDSECLGSGSQPWFPTSGFSQRFIQSHFDWNQWLVYHQTNRYHFIATPLWDHLIEAPWTGWWTNKKANQGTNGKGWKVFPINTRWGSPVISQRTRTPWTHLKRILRWLFFFLIEWSTCLEVVHCPPVLWILLLPSFHQYGRKQHGDDSSRCWQISTPEVEAPIKTPPQKNRMVNLKRAV